MSVAMHRKIRITGRLAHWAGVLWLALFAAQLSIAIHDELVFATDAVNYLDVRTSVKVTAGFLVAIGAVNLAAWTLRSWWRRQPPPYLDWMIKYNVRVAVVWGCTAILHSLATRFAQGPNHDWLLAHLSLGYALGTAGALTGAPLLFTRRWHEPEPADLVELGEQGEQVEQVEQVEPLEPAEPAVPVAPADPVEQGEPIEPIEIGVDDTPTGPIPIVRIPSDQPLNRD